MQNIAVILAGGSGKRAGGDVPKQFFKIADKTILEYSLEKFEDNSRIDEIVVVGNPDYLDAIRRILRARNFSKVKHILPGGQERYHSVLAALEIYKDIACNLLIHDAVRPMVSRRIIDEVIQNLQTCRAVNVAVPCADTLIEVDAVGEYITGIPDRNRFYRVQTPQGFNAQTLFFAYSQALNDPDFTTTDDCSVIRKYVPGEKIKIVRGENTNIKLTYPEDFFLLEHLLNQEKQS